MNLKTNWRLGLWQLVFLSLSLSWFLAPYLNHFLSYRSGLISQYELPGQPYSWLFRLCDLLAATLLAAVAWQYKNIPGKRNGCLILLLIAVGMLVDPIFSTTCRFSNGVCIEYVSFPFFLHAAETVITSTGIFVLALYDSLKRRRVVSIGFLIFQVLYGLLFVSQLATQNHFNTFSQFFYEMGIIVWLAWYVRDYVVDMPNGVTVEKSTLIKDAIAFWAFLNGIFSVLISLADIRVVGKLKGLYFAGDSAWLAQHGMIVGVVLIYLSRHLRRGERRARHIFMGIAALESLKYAVITPHPGLLSLYFATFCILFIFKQPFDRGISELTWRLRLKEAIFLTASLVLAAAVALLVLYSNSHDSDITTRSLDHYLDFTVRQHFTPDSRLESALLAHAISAFILSFAVLVLWILFRPARPKNANVDKTRALQLVREYSASTEDFFKIWPNDKKYFYSKDGFIAYKVSGPIAYALADPIAPSSTERAALLNDFIAYCKEHGWKIAFLPIYKQGLPLFKKAGLNLIQIGASAVIDTDKFLNETVKDKWWRWKNNKATKSGLVYRISSAPHEAKLLNELKIVSNAWLSKEGRQERGFALGFFDRGYLNQCDIHYLSNSEGRLVAFANQIPQFKQHDTATIDLIRHLPEVGEAMSYLLYQIILHMNEGSYKYFDLGFVPFAASEQTIVKLVKTLSGGRFSASGLEQFKNKFDPVWTPNYLAYEGDIADLALITLNLEGAMAQPKT